eukprot:COSAG01_NODE_783_length_13630_cov_5.556459_5_plen_163_part_00
MMGSHLDHHVQISNIRERVLALETRLRHAERNAIEARQQAEAMVERVGAAVLAQEQAIEAQQQAEARTERLGARMLFLERAVHTLLGDSRSSTTTAHSPAAGETESGGTATATVVTTSPTEDTATNQLHVRSQRSIAQTGWVCPWNPLHAPARNRYRLLSWK